MRKKLSLQGYTLLTLVDEEIDMCEEMINEYQCARIYKECAPTFEAACFHYSIVVIGLSLFRACGWCTELSGAVMTTFVSCEELTK